MYKLEIDWPGDNLPFYFDEYDEYFSSAKFFNDHGYIVILYGEVEEENE